MCSWSESSFPLDGHLAFSEQAVSCEFPLLSRCLLTLQLCFDFVYPRQSFLDLYIAAIQLVQVLQMHICNVTCNVQIHSSKKMSKQVLAHFQQYLIIDT